MAPLEQSDTQPPPSQPLDRQSPAPRGSTKGTASMAEKPLIGNLKFEMQEFLQKPLVKGDAWYLVDNHWFKQFKKYVGLCLETPYDSGGEWDPALNPGPIENKPLFKEESLQDGQEPDIRELMIDEMDYVLVPEDAWKLLVGKFGVGSGCQEVRRVVVEHGMFVKHCKVEVYYMEFQLADNSSLEESHKKKFSKSDTLETIGATMRQLFNIPEEEETRLWNKYTSNTYEHLSRMTDTVQDAGLFTGQLIIIERKNEDGTWPRQAPDTNARRTSTSPIPTPPHLKSTFDQKEASPVAGALTGPTTSSQASSRYNFSGSSATYGDGGVSEKAQPGICGLSNLGNTCFMNSIIQGLSNTPQVTEYFDNDNYLEDINEDNPLGMKGEIARTFGQLIKDMWSGKYTYVVPRAFKMAVGKFAPQFSGYQQQDSQELLTFLLDGLHEDLNRIKQKPYIEMTDSDSKPDHEVAMEAWENYKKRNDSVILDIFHGLLKSTVVCPECPKVSVTFDPSCYLSLPLPVKKERQIDVFLVHLDPSKPPTQYKVTVPKNGIMSELCSALGKMSGAIPENLMVTDVYNHRFHKIYTGDDQLSHILERDDIFIYETAGTSKESKTVTVPVYLRERKSSSTYAPTNLFGQPFLVTLPSEITQEKLHSALLDRMARYVSKPSEDDEWWRPPPKVEDGNNGNSPDDIDMNGETSETGNEESPVSETSDASKPAASTNGTTEDDEMLSEDDESGPQKIFSLHLVNSYGNAQIEPLSGEPEELVQLSSKNYLSLDWHPRAKQKFFNDKAAEEFNQDESFHGKVAPKKQTIKLSECLKLYTSQEKLGAEDAWYCPKCEKHQQATKKFDLWSLPEMLVIHLKRFSYNRYYRDKIDTLIDFPITNLDMTPYVINPSHGQAVYDLISVSNHYGGMGGGHYTAYGKNKTDGNWYYFDDSSVTQTNEEAVVTKAAYVLFYQRRTSSKASNISSRRVIPSAAGSAEALVNGGTPTTNGHDGNQSEEEMEVN